MNRNYEHPGVSAHWCDVHGTHKAVATAIHAISDSTRSPDAIWSDPTEAEWDHVKCAVQEYVSRGDFEREDDGRYPWGETAIVLDE